MEEAQKSAKKQVKQGLNAGLFGLKRAGETLADAATSKNDSYLWLLLPFFASEREPFCGDKGAVAAHLTLSLSLFSGQLNERTLCFALLCHCAVLCVLLSFLHSFLPYYSICCSAVTPLGRRKKERKKEEGKEEGTLARSLARSHFAALPRPCRDIQPRMAAQPASPHIPAGQGRMWRHLAASPPMASPATSQQSGPERQAPLPVPPEIYSYLLLLSMAYLLVSKGKKKERKKYQNPAAEIPDYHVNPGERHPNSDLSGCAGVPLTSLCKIEPPPRIPCR